MNNFFSELKRRNVFRVGIAYTVVGWLLVQVTAYAVPAFSMPPWVNTVVFYFILIGFPLALLFAWAYELTPEGLKRSHQLDSDNSITAHTGRKLDFVIIGALVVALGYFVWESRFAQEPGTGDAAAAGASIAVLAFVNLSSDPEQEYFTDGISEEILNALARIPDLHVTSRSSAFSFKGKNVDIPTVARQLGVAHILEGSVRKSGSRIRITAQLIEASSDKHLWSGIYERELEEIFAVQDEISAAIVAALTEKLSIATEAAPQVKAAANVDAYTAFLLGQYLIRKRTKTDIEASARNFERAIELDPEYAPAHAGLALAWYLLLRSRTTYGTLTLEESMGKALPQIERALALDTELAEAHGIMGLLLAALGRFEEAVKYYKEALRLNSSLTNVRNWYSRALTALGRPAESFQAMETAYRLDPLSVLTGNNYAKELWLRQRFDKLEPVLDRLGQIDPTREAVFRGLALGSQQRPADGAIVMLRSIDASPSILRIKREASFLLANIGMTDEALRLWPHPDGGREIIALGTDYGLTLVMAQERFQDEPDNPNVFNDLALAYFYSGDGEQAEKLAERYLNTLSPARRSIDFSNLIFILNARKRGDDQGMLARLRPLEANSEAQLAAGLDFSGLHFRKAIYAFVRGGRDEAYEHAERAISIGPGRLDPKLFQFPYHQLGWNEKPRFVALKERYEAYLRAERLKLLAVACGEDGFETWQPLPETCEGYLEAAE